MKNWIAFIIVFILFVGGGIVVGVPWGRAWTNDILLKNMTEHEQTYLRLEAKHVNEIVWQEKSHKKEIKEYQKVIEQQQRNNGNTLRLLEQFKNRPVSPYFTE